MRKRDPQRAPDDGRNRGRAETAAPETSIPSPERTAEPSQSPMETPPDADRGGRRISGPGPNDLTRGLP